MFWEWDCTEFFFNRVVKDGVETVTVMENGKVVSNMVNGVEKIESLTDGSDSDHYSSKKSRRKW